jgi:hypothetical protein
MAETLETLPVLHSDKPEHEREFRTSMPDTQRGFEHASRPLATNQADEDENYHLDAFIELFTECAPGAETPANLLWLRYDDWMRSNGFMPMLKAVFQRKVRARFGIREGVERRYCGIRLVDLPETEAPAR